MRSVLRASFGWFVALGFIAALAGCSSTEVAEGTVTPEVASIVVVEYKGHPLTCVTSGGSHSEVSKSCDFVEYHEKFGFTE